ncbi:MAG: NUDIX hydrolase [Maricaulaceae bacterium]
MKHALLLSAALLLAACGGDNAAVPADNTAAPAEHSVDIFDGAWNAEQSAPILAKTMRLRFPYDDSLLSEGEKLAVKELLLAGERLHTLYLEQVHPDARAVEAALSKPDARKDLQELFRMMKGPVATTLDNGRETFLNVRASTAARNVYPLEVTRETFDAHLESYPEERDFLLHLRGVVKAATPENKAAALKQLDGNSIHDTLHPNLRPHIERAEGYFALPYSVAYADDVLYVYDRLNAAAAHVKADDIAFSRYLRLRARDLLADNYDGGDAAWITGEFTGNLNAQIGSYETYDDALYGVKSFFSLSLLQRDKPKSDELAASIGDIQSIEDALPYTANKSVRSDIPVGVYNIIADFGQARGTNTATILPNEGHLSRQYGRTILIRSTVLRNPDIFAEAKTSFEAATAQTHKGDLDIDGNFYRTLWHEIGHYMGPDQTAGGGDIDAALQDSADLMEEMKADLVSLFSAQKLYDADAYTQSQLRSIYAGGILRVMQKNRPRREQAYGTMKLIQFNWFRDKGLITFENGALSIDYARYPEAVSTLLKEVLAIQHSGDRETANGFVDHWTTWEDKVHGAIGTTMKDAEGSRYRYVTYEALGE